MVPSITEPSYSFSNGLYRKHLAHRDSAVGVSIGHLVLICTPMLTVYSHLVESMSVFFLMQVNKIWYQLYYGADNIYVYCRTGIYLPGSLAVEGSYDLVMQLHAHIFII